MKGTEDDKYIEKILERHELEGTAYFTGDNYSSAIIGYTEDGSLVYSYEKMIEWLMNMYNITQEEAIDWINYNVIGTAQCMSGIKPIIVYELIE